jgi:hypothetical protein
MKFDLACWHVFGFAYVLTRTAILTFDEIFRAMKAIM